MKSLTDISLSALKWDYAGTATRAISSLIISIVLARLLGPEPFGLVAVAWLFVGLGNLVADLGMGPALVQRKNISSDDVRYAFTMQLCVGIALTGVVVVSAPLFGQVFKQPKVVPVIQAMSFIFILQTFGVIAVSLLTRELDFRTIQSARICSYLVGFLALGIPLALLGLEVWSLVIAQLSQTALFSILCYGRVRHRIRPLFTSPSRGLSAFGSKVLLTNIVNWGISSIDSIFIGRFFDTIILGLYNRAYVLVSTPMANLVVTVQKVLFPAYSRLQSDTETIRKVYLACAGFMALMLLPTYVSVALVPVTVIQGVFGQAWEAAIPFLVPLALSMPFHGVMAIGGPMLWAQNRVGRELAAQLGTLLIALVIFFVTAQISATALVWGSLGCSIVRFFLITHASLRTIRAPWSAFLRSISGSVVLLIPTSIMLLSAEHILLLADTSATLRLGIDMCLGASVLLATVFWVPQLVLSAEMRWFADRLATRLPLSIRPLMKRFSPVDSADMVGTGGAASTSAAL